MRSFALAMILGVVLVIAIANLGYASWAFSFVQYIPGRDLTGHLVIFGMLSFAINAWIERPAPVPSLPVQARASALLAVLVTLEESSQALLPTRTFSLPDLAASLAGVVAGLLAAIWLGRARRNAST